MNIGERIRYLRKDILHITQEALGEPLGLSRANIANIESGRISVTERVINDISEKFHVNEEWLRYERGEIIQPLERSQIITDFVGDLIKEEDSFRTRLIEALAKLDDTEWEVLEKLAESLSQKKG